MIRVFFKIDYNNLIMNILKLNLIILKQKINCKLIKQKYF